MKISACVITKNEEKNIERCIRSCMDIVDEIIVVDSGSTDDTVKIAKKMGAKVYHRDWDDDFAAAKNDAIDKATGDWIIFLDADEYFDVGGAHRAKELMLLADKNKQIDAISVNMKHFADEQGSILMIHPIARIFKNTPQCRYVSKVHEYLEKDGKKLNALAVDDVILLHTGYIQEIMPDKLRRNLQLLEELDTPPNMMCDVELSKAECHNGLKDYDKVLICIEKVMTNVHFNKFLIGSAKAPDVYKFKVEAMLALKGNYTDREIEKCIEEGIAHFPTHPEIMQLKVKYLYERNRRSEAIEYLEKALELDKKYKEHYINSFSGAHDKKYAALGDLYTFYRNDIGKARQCYEKALKLSRYNLEALSGYLWSLESSEIQFIIRNLDRFYDRSNSDDIRMILTAGLLCGLQDVFTTYFMYFAKSWPEKLVADRLIINKVNLMKRDYNSLLGAEDPFWFIGAIATDQAEGQSRWQGLFENQRREIFLASVSELTQAKDEALLERLLANRRYCHDDAYEDLAKIFEWQRKFDKAGAYYKKAGMIEEARRMKMLAEIKNLH